MARQAGYGYWVQCWWHCERPFDSAKDSAGDLVRVRETWRQCYRPGNSAWDLVTVVETWWHCNRPFDSAKALVTVWHPWWQYKRPGDSARDLVTMWMTFWQCERPGDSVRDLVTVRETWWQCKTLGLKSCRSPIALAGRIGLTGRIGILAEYSQHFGLALSLGFRSKALTVPEKIDFQHWPLLFKPKEPCPTKNTAYQ